MSIHARGGRDTETEKPMKKVLLATSALVATAGFATAQGVAVSGSASMGVLGGDWVDDGPNDGNYELHTDINVNFTMPARPTPV